MQASLHWLQPCVETPSIFLFDLFEADEASYTNSFLTAIHARLFRKETFLYYPEPKATFTPLDVVVVDELESLSMLSQQCRTSR